MNIHERFKEIVEYFKAKLIAGDYEMIECDHRTAHIIIDGKYPFQIWISDPLNYLNFYETSWLVENPNEFLNIDTEDERREAWKNMEPHVRRYRNAHLKYIKEHELSKIQDELDVINKQLKEE